jgi:O-antigen/teichoic acid export membrane protein
MDYVITFFAIFFTDVFYVYYFKSVQNNKALKAGAWAGAIAIMASIAVINYTHDNWHILSVGLGAFCGTYIGMIIRKKHET